MYNAEKSNFDHIVERQRMLREKRAAQEQKCNRCLYKTEISPEHIYCPFSRCMEERGEAECQQAGTIQALNETKTDSLSKGSPGIRAGDRKNR